MRTRLRRGPKSVGGAIAVVLLALLMYAAQRSGFLPASGPSSPNAPSSAPAGPRVNDPARPAQALHPAPVGDDGGLSALYRDKRSDVWVELTATVEKRLPDDAEGDRHQKFIIRVGPELRVLVAHNIDAAKRVPVKEGDTVRIRGEYEYTDKGGTLHFTHKPKFQRRQPGGWIEHAGVRYE